MLKNGRALCAAALVLLMCLALLGCQSPATPPSGDAPAPAPAGDAPAGDAAGEPGQGNDGLTLTPLHIGFNDTQIEAANIKDTGPTPSDRFYMTNREKIEAAYPNVTFEWNDWGWAEALDQKQRAAISAGTPPTNIAGEAFIPSYINAGILQEVPADIIEGINKSFIAWGEDGKPYGIAFKTSTFMLFYNKDLFTAAGLDPETPPTTWEEWRAMSDQITKAGAGQFWGGGIPSFPHNGGALRATPFFRQLGTDFGGYDEINLNDPKVQQALKYIRDMNAFLPAGLGNNTDEGPMWEAFEKEGQQNIGFAVNGAWQMPNGLRNNLNVGVAPLPLPEGGQPGNCLVGTVYIGVPVGVSEEETRLFWELYRNIVLSEEQLNYFIEDSCVVPLQSMIDDASLYEGDDKAALRVAIEDLKSGTYAGQAAFVKNDGQIWEIINQQVLARVTMTDDPIETICAEAQAQIEALLQ